MAGGDRAINMALRVLGIGEVERDFQRVGQAGSKAFVDVKRSANGAAQEVSEYTARLRRAVAEAKRMAGSVPQLNKPTAQSRTDRLAFIKGAVGAEQDRMVKGLPELSRALGQGGAAADGMAGGLTRLGVAGAGAGVMITGLYQAAKASLEAFMAHEQALDAFEAKLSLTGNRTQATGDEIRAMAEAVVESTRQTETAALQGAQALAQVSGLTREAMEEALLASARYADAIGAELPEVLSSTTIPILQALAQRDMKALWQATEDLNDPLRAAIMNLAEAGRTADAQRALFTGLAQAAGDGPGGAAMAANRLSDGWARLKAALGENIAGPAAAGLNWLASILEGLNVSISNTSINWRRMLTLGTISPIGGFMASARFAPQNGSGSAAPDMFGMGSLVAIGQQAGQASAGAQLAAFDRKYGGGGGGARRARGGGGGARRAGGGGVSAKDTLKREADQAEQESTRIEQANLKAIESWAQRTKDIEALVGLEGEALKAVERQQKVEAAARQLNTDLIEKQVEEARKRAALEKRPFDEAAARASATAAYQEQEVAVRELAERYVDAEEELARFNRRQSEAKALLEQMKSPLDKLNDEVDQAIVLLQAGAITADQFNLRMKQLAGDLAEVRHELDEGAKAWEGFGQDVAQSLVDIAFNGGSAIDILQQLIRLPLDRLIEQQFTNPVADWIDGQTGNNHQKNTAAALAGLPTAGKVLGADAIVDGGLEAASAAAAGSVGQMALQTELASQALMRFIGSLQVGGVGPGIGAGGSGLASLIDLFGGGGASLGGAGSGLAAAGGALAGLPGFAGGTDRVPVGNPFWVGENGKELMQYHANGRLEVINGPRSHRVADGGGGATIINQTLNIPPRADPRRTAAGVARSTQGALARAGRKGLAGTRS